MLTIQVNNQLHTLDAFPPEQTLLDFLRGNLSLTGTKEGCASGDCGACTVLVGHGGEVTSLNACITPLGALQGGRVYTVEAMQKDDTLHPVQAAMIEAHGSQCGFCTPGFVMSLIGHSLTPDAATDRNSIVEAIGGNLCRCTGYKPIIAAGMRGCAAADPDWLEPEKDRQADALVAAGEQTRVSAEPKAQYDRPSDLGALADLYAAAPGARLVAGATDLWLEATQRQAAFNHIIDLSGITDLRAIESDGDDLIIGAGVSHAQLQAYFSQLSCGAIAELLSRFGSPQVRNRGTIGGNLGNASPIADWPPLLLCLEAELELRHGANTRHLPLLSFYTGYRQTELAPGEFISRIRIPGPVDWRSLHFHKVSKRIEDDISSVAGAFLFTVQDGVIQSARIAYGGMAATPLRLTSLEPQLQGQRRDNVDLDAMDEWLAANLAPISDVRASARYRLAMAQNMLRKSLDAALS